MEENIKINPDEYENLTLKYLPHYLKSAKDGEVWAQRRLYDVWRACLDAHTHQESHPLNLFSGLIQFLSSV